jgi:hypothetical protein
MKKKTILIASVIFGVLLVGSLFISNPNSSESDFDYCRETELFGLKYQSCDTIECAEFHESIKEKLRENCNGN